jgi:hypothetical protein
VANLGQFELDSSAPDGLIAEQPPEKQEAKAIDEPPRFGIRRPRMVSTTA